ncbi:MAG: C-terminal binding protein [Propionibacteriaceae bacterium]|nr:C-terminal binding protein [Propionibacteriaceae bacterium]
MRIVITECDHDAFAQEQQEAMQAGAELEIRQDKGAAQVIAGARDADGICVQYANITAEVMDALPKLRAIGRYGVGVDTLDIDAATQRGIAVCNVPDYGTEAVSDHAIGLAMTLARGIMIMDRGMRTGQFDFSQVRPLYQTKDRVFGVIGLGRIGLAVARKAAGLGYHVIGHDILAADANRYQGVETTTLNELLRRSQVISIHVPLTPQTHHMLGASAFQIMRRDAVVINTARGGVIDTAALIAALQTGAIAGAGLDTHEIEPVPAGHPLLSLDNLVLTPHFAWYTEESYGELKRRTIANVIDICQNRRPRDIINPEVLGRPGRNSSVK